MITIPTSPDTANLIATIPAPPWTVFPHGYLSRRSA